MEQTDVTLLNAGGLRADLPAGELTFGGLYEVFPFDNTVSTITLTGEQILKCFEVLASSGHGAPQIAGLRREGPQVRGTRVTFTEASFATARPFDPRGHLPADHPATFSPWAATGWEGVDAIPARRRTSATGASSTCADALAAFLEKRGGALTGRIDGRLEIDSAGCTPAP
jgi:5'-nucleotidase